MTDFEPWRPARGAADNAAAPNGGGDAGAQINNSGSGLDGLSFIKAKPAKRRSLALKSNGTNSRKAASKSAAPLPPIIGSSPQIKALREKIALFAPEDDPVLIVGETGAGKELVAHEVHSRSSRAGGPLIVRNVGRIDRELAGSDFFGHTKGAFTGASDKRVGLFEQANGGSLHLDEIAELPLELQANLLRVVEDGQVMPLGGSAPKAVNVRLIAATNVDLGAAVESREFRDDLYYRLSVLRLQTPPLRERGDDLFEIADYWLAQRSAARGVSQIRLTSDAAARLQAYSWPGNVRELKNVLTSAAVLAGGDMIGAEHIFFNPPCSANRGSFDINDGRDLIAQYLAAKALKATGGNVSQAAKLTNYNRTSFHELKTKMTEERADLSALARQLREFLRIC